MAGAMLGEVEPRSAGILDRARIGRQVIAAVDTERFGVHATVFSISPRQCTATNIAFADKNEALHARPLHIRIGLIDTAQLFERMMADKPHPEMGYRGCLGVIRLAGKYSPARMEAAAERALLTGTCRYCSIVSILKYSLDQQPLPPSSAPPATPPSPHDNIRGAEYFE